MKQGQHPYPHRVTIRKYIVSPNFSLGVGCSVNLTLASFQLTKLLRAVLKIDSTALKMSDATKSYLLNERKNPRNQSGIPCVYVPKPIDYQPRILDPILVHGK